MKSLRSMIFVPANQHKFFDTAIGCGSDGILVDLEDTLPEAEHNISGEALSDVVTTLGKGGAEMLVRVNNVKPYLVSNLEACVQAGVSGIMVPKVESSTDIVFADRYLSHLEHKAGLPNRSIALFALIETTKGVVNAEEIIGSSPRIRNVSLGTGDYCRELGYLPTMDSSPFYYPFSKIANLAISKGIEVSGVLGSIGDYRDLEGFEKCAVSARRLGSTGSPCLMPEQVAILNRVFSPSDAEIAWAKRVVPAFEKSVLEGDAGFELDGKFVCYAVYSIAQNKLRKAAELEML